MRYRRHTSAPVSSLHLELLEEARQCGEDGAGTIQIAASRAETPRLSHVLSEHAVALDGATQRLSTALMELGERPDQGASMRARLERALLALSTHLPRSDEIVLRECALFERAIASAIVDVMSLPWPHEIRPALDEAYATVRRCMAEIEVLRSN